MDKGERINLYQQAIMAWGIEAQIRMVMEESGEMLAAIGKATRDRASEEEVITELADVCIMMEQMAVWFGTLDGFEEEKERKLQRLKERLDAYWAKKLEEKK